MIHRNDSRDLIIAVLCLTATVLLCAVLLLDTIGQRPALAELNDRGGDYVVCTGSVSSGKELLYIIDAAAKRMNVYELDNSGRFEIGDSVDLSRVFVQPSGR